MPAVVEPNTLCDQLRPSLTRKSKAKQQKNRQVFECGMIPDDLSASNALPIAPSVDNIEAEQTPKAHPRETLERVFGRIFRIANLTVLAVTMEITIRQLLLDAGKFASSPAILPALRSEAMR